MDNQLFDIVSQILEHKDEEFNNNEVFSMVSLITLNQIINLYQNIDKSSNQQTLNSLVNNLSKQNIPNNNSGNMDIETLLPVMLNLLGNKNNLGKLLNSMNTSRNNQNEQTQNSNNNQRQEKKNNKYVKKN